VVKANPADGCVYVGSSQSVSVLSKTQSITTIHTSDYYPALAETNSSGYVYMADKGWLDVKTNAVTTTVLVMTKGNIIAELTLPGWASAIGANSITGYVYVASYDTYPVSFSRLTVLSDTQIVTTTDLKTTVNAIAASPLSGYVYLANADNTVSVLNGTQIIETLPVGDYPYDIAVNPHTGLVYVSNYYGRSITVIADPIIPRPAITVTQQIARFGPIFTYTLYVTNTGTTLLHATVTDTLPLHIMSGTTPSGSLILPGGALTWQPLLTAPGGVWAQTLVVTVEAGYTGWLTNMLQVTTREGASGVYTATTAVKASPKVYLPLVLRQA
jgi:uncharacterized repeat protein (TIGR01451 family)